MVSLSPLRCTYCDTVSDWSAERTDALELSETHCCPECEQDTPVWDDTEVQSLADSASMPWVDAGSFY